VTLPAAGGRYETSRPSRARGLKHHWLIISGSSSYVAPFTGAWIETINMFWDPTAGSVAPFTGAWIETRRFEPGSVVVGVCRALHGRVD